MKKLLLSLSTITTIMAPLATVVACGDDVKFVLEDFAPKEDGLYLIDEYYGGTLYDQDGIKFTNGALEIVEYGHKTGTDPVIQFGKKDSFVVVYDNDDEDGFTIDNFEETFAYSDSSTVYSSTLATYNVAEYDNVFASNESGDTTAVFTTFENGFSNRHIGSTFGFGDTTASVEALKDVYTEKDFNAILDTYKYVENADGSLGDQDGFDDSGGGADEYLRGTKSIAPQDGKSMFSYERITDNAIKVTYLFDDDSFDQDSGSFGFITETEVDGEYTMDNKGTFSFGENSWAKYNNDEAHIYQGKKV